MPLGPPSCTTTARGISRGGFLLEDVQLAAHALKPRPLVAGEHRVPVSGAQPERAAGRKQFLVELGQWVGPSGLVRLRIEPGPAQVGFDELAFGVVELAVVDAELGEVSAEPRAAAGARPAQTKSGDGWVGRHGIESLAGAGRRHRCGASSHRAGPR